jgi:hypothetical protein
MKTTNIVALTALTLFTLGCTAIVGVDQFRVEPRDAGPDGGVDGRVPMPDGGIDAGPPPEAPPTPLLRFPWNGYFTGSPLSSGQPAARNAMRPRFVWEPTDRAERYEIQISSACEAATRDNCPFGEELAGTTEMTEWRPDTPLAVNTFGVVGRRYFWRVRACNRGGCSEFSEVRYLEVGRQPNDYNGDGYADLMVGTLQGNELYLYRGPSLSAADVVTPTGVVGPWGFIAAHVGDVTGDGRSDVVVGAHEDTADGLEEAGRVFLVPEGTRWFAVPPLVSPNAEANGAFGAAVAGGCDLDGNGVMDFVVGAPGETVEGQARAGRVYVYLFEMPDRVPEPVVLTSPLPETEGEFGWSLSCTGDLDGDGFTDLAVGAYRESSGGLLRMGRVHLFEGGRDGISATASVTATSPMAVFQGGFGGTVTMGDVDGDGFADLLIAAGSEAVGETPSGVVYFARGRRDGVGALVRWEPPRPVEFGAFGVDQLVVPIEPRGALLGAVREDSILGNVYFLPLDGKPTVLERTIPMGPAAFGLRIGWVGDVEGNGSAVLAIGAPLEEAERQPNAGRVHIYAWSSTPTRTRELLAPAPQMDGNFGMLVTSRAGLTGR